MGVLLLYGQPGWGSAIVELQLDWYGLGYRFEAVGHLFKDPAARARLEAVNPLGQIPTLVLPDGAVMTESAAITLWLAEQYPDRALAPPSGHSRRAQFLRWLIFITSNIYPTYTYGDVPARFVPDTAAQQDFSDAVEAWRQRLYRQLEAQADTPWFFGERLTALDVYCAVLLQWEPGADWFRRETPALWRIAEAIRAHTPFAAAWARNRVVPDT